MNESRALINALIVILQTILIVVYALDIKIPYPAFIITAFETPLTRILTYIVLFGIAYYNPIISVLSLVCVVTLHLDIINFVEHEKNKS